MAHFIADGSPTNLVALSAGGTATVDLFGGGPGGERLDVVSTDPTVFTVTEVQASVGLNLRRFTLRGAGAGSARLLGRLGPGGPAWAESRVITDRRPLWRYYHGTNNTVADILLGEDITPHLLERLYASAVTMFDWTDYTDFGKGFYAHLEENKAMAYGWAKREHKANWAVVEFIATEFEMRDLWATALHFANKTHRPHNSPRPVTVTTTTRTVEVCLPQLLPILPCATLSRSETVATAAPQTMSWLEFVEHNRHINRGGALIARPNDRDWTGTYSRLRGPLWVPRDSGYDTGLPKFPDHIHQVNFGQAGMNVLNATELKTRRFKFNAANEGLFPPPSG